MVLSVFALTLSFLFSSCHNARCIFFRFIVLFRCEIIIFIRNKVTLFIILLCNFFQTLSVQCATIWIFCVFVFKKCVYWFWNVDSVCVGACVERTCVCDCVYRVYVVIWSHFHRNIFKFLSYTTQVFKRFFYRSDEQIEYLQCVFC